MDVDGSEAKLMMGKLDYEDHKLEEILGVWMPLSPDYPLAIMDARTLHPVDAWIYVPEPKWSHII